MRRSAPFVAPSVFDSRIDLTNVDQVVLKFERLCYREALKLADLESDFFEDLMQVGFETLLRCCKAFNPAKASANAGSYRHFYNYALTSIRNEMLNELAKLKLARSKPKRRKDGARAVEVLPFVTYADDETLDKLARPIYFESEIEEKLRRERLIKIVKEALEALDERLRFLIEARFGFIDGKTYDGKAVRALYIERFGEPPKRLNSMYKTAFRKMRAVMVKKGYDKEWKSLAIAGAEAA